MIIEKKVSLEIDNKTQDEAPKDRYWIVYCIFFLTGIVHVLPWTFFLTAHEYWMYKFRDTTYENDDPKHRTKLQTQFSPSLTICRQLCTIAFLTLGLVFGRRFTINFKLFGSLGVMLTFFIVAAIFIHIDTDDWQVGFFVLTVFIVGCISAMDSIFGMAVYSILAHFPKEHLAAYLNGQGLASIFTSSLQVASLAVSISTEGSALVYFWLGNAVIAVSVLLMVLVVKYNQFYQYMTQNQVIEEKKMLSLNEIKRLSKKVWPSVAAMGFYILTMMTVSPSITSLVVSENRGDSEWNDRYFLPVTVFFLPAVVDYIGRIAAEKLKINIEGIWLTAFSALRMVLFVPLLMLCNAQPRKHLPVIFPHDYQFIIIILVSSISGGYLLSMISLIIPRLVPPEELESAFHVFMVEGGIILGAFSAISSVGVELL